MPHASLVRDRAPTSREERSAPSGPGAVAVTSQAAGIISERELLEYVVELAQALGWQCHHVLDTRHHAKVIGPGFPDLVLVRPPAVIFAELKAQTGRLTDDQLLWGGGLAECPGVTYYVWRPSDMPEIERVLIISKGERGETLLGQRNLPALAGRRSGDTTGGG